MNPLEILFDYVLHSTTLTKHNIGKLKAYKQGFFKTCANQSLYRVVYLNDMPSSLKFYKNKRATSWSYNQGIENVFYADYAVKVLLKSKPVPNNCVIIDVYNALRGVKPPHSISEKTRVKRYALTEYEVLLEGSGIDLIESATFFPYDINLRQHSNIPSKVIYA